MGHGLTERDGMFTVRKAAWHGLGEVLSDYPTREEAQRVAHGWEPIDEPLYVAEPTFETRPTYDDSGDLVDEPVTDYAEIPGYRAVRRSDNGNTIGVVSDTYQIVNNSEMYDIAEAIEGEAKGSVMYETGGSLNGGSKVWLMIRLRDPLKIPGDRETETIPYYAIQNAHDGSGSFRGQAVMTRIVCDNTANAADLESVRRGTGITFQHTKNIKSRINEAQQALAGWRDSVETYERMCAVLADEKISNEQIYQYRQLFIPEPSPALATDRVRNNVSEAREQWINILDSETCDSIRNTRYGLLQASIEYLQHCRRSNTQESRFKRAYLTRDKLVQDSLRIAKVV